MRTSFRPLKYSWLVPAAIFLGSCGSEQADYVSTRSKLEGLRAVDAVDTADRAQKSNSDSQKPSGTPADLGLPQTISLIDSTFNIVAKTAGNPACKGQMKINVNAALSSTATTQLLQVPQGGMDCGWLGKTDLAKLFGAFSEPPAKGEDPLVIANNVLALKALGTGTYSPARPLLPSFLAASRDELAKLNYTERNITLKTPKGSAKGNVSVKMNYYDQPKTVPGTNYNFKHVMNFTITNTGFEGSGVDKFGNFIFDSIEFTMSTSPVSIIGIKLKGNLKSQFIATKQNLGAVSGLLQIITFIVNADPTGILLAITGLLPVELELSLSNQVDLENQLKQVDANSSEAIGEVIGGQAAG